MISVWIAYKGLKLLTSLSQELSLLGRKLGCVWVTKLLLHLKILQHSLLNLGLSKACFPFEDLIGLIELEGSEEFRHLHELSACQG